VLQRKKAISICYSFPPHLTTASALPEKMQYSEIASFHSNMYH